MPLTIPNEFPKKNPYPMLIHWIRVQKIEHSGERD